MNSKLSDLLKKKQKQSGFVQSIDWDDRRRKYLQAVDRLYTLIKTMLEAPIKEGSVQFRQSPKDLAEDYIGTYAIDDLVLFIGDEQVRFSPCGRNVAGAEGRVDVVGERGESNLIFCDSDWWVVQGRQPSLRIARLDESTLADILSLVMRD